jgi:hypothetical protein
MPSRFPCVDILLSGEVVTMNNVSYRLVSQFNYAKFTDIYLPSSSKYAKDLANYDVLCAEIFHVGEVWKSRDLLADVLKAIAMQHDWKSTLNSVQIRCNRFGKPR